MSDIGAPDWQKGTGDVCGCESEDFEGDESAVGKV